MRGQVYPAAGETEDNTTTVAVSYLVEYCRPAEDEAAFIEYYCANHPPIMAALPKIRRLEIYTPVDWSNPLALERADHMLMCDTSFDDTDALTGGNTETDAVEDGVGLRSAKPNGNITELHFALQTGGGLN